jgi:thiosulfate reductase cytochrome b subunit
MVLTEFALIERRYSGLKTTKGSIMAIPETAEVENNPKGSLYYRHRLPVRITHWINVVCLTILFMSGLGIFNAHPALYWGASSYTGHPPLLEITSRTISGNAPQAASASDDATIEPEPGAPAKKGILRIFGHEFDTTGVLGVSTSPGGGLNQNAFPHWLTIPGFYALSTARLWHFFFAWLFVINGLLYVLYAFLSGHFRRDLAPDRQEMRGIGASIKEHLQFRHPEGEAAKRYNVLQKLAYLSVIFVLLPLVILMGMAMSPMLDTVLTGWVDWFGGRQSARTIHFIVAWLLVAFVLIHVFEVIVSGLWNHLRSMITGYYFVKSESGKENSP